MSFKRVFKWLCDTCQQTAETESYGLPNGWVWLVHGGHACSECQSNFSDREKGRSGSMKTIKDE